MEPSWTTPCGTTGTSKIVCKINKHAIKHCLNKQKMIITSLDFRGKIEVELPSRQKQTEDATHLDTANGRSRIISNPYSNLQMKSSELC